MVFWMMMDVGQHRSKYFNDQFGDRVHQKWTAGNLVGYSGVPFASPAQKSTLRADMKVIFLFEERP